MSQFTTISATLKGRVATGTDVTVRGWLRSKRDSKAGISFLAIHDGTAFDAIQAVVPADLNNYESEVLKLSAGCSVIVTGELVVVGSEGISSFGLEAVVGAAATRFSPMTTPTPTAAPTAIPITKTAATANPTTHQRT